MITQTSLLSISLATVCVESLLYGLFCALFAFSTYLSITRHHIEQPGVSNWRGSLWTPLFCGSIGLFCMLTAHWILTVIRLFEAFLWFDGGQTPFLFYANLGQITEVVKTGFLVVTMVLGDVLLMYRVWIVWNHKISAIIVPLCTVTGLTVCAIGLVRALSHLRLGDDVFTSVAASWVTSDAVLSLFTNIYCTALILWKIWRVNISSRSLRVGVGSNLNHVLAMIVESAAIYTAWAIFFLATFRLQSDVHFLIVDGYPAMIGISFMLINLRVELGWAHRAIYSQASKRNVGQNMDSSATSRSYSMRPLAVNITISDETDVDGYKVSDPGKNGMA